MGKFGFERGVAVLQQVNIGPPLTKKKLSAYSTKAKIGQSCIVFLSHSPLILQQTAKNRVLAILSNHYV